MYHNLTMQFNRHDNTIELPYIDDAAIFIYLNNNLLVTSDNFNSKTSLPNLSGIYRIEIITEQWTAVGFIEI